MYKKFNEMPGNSRIWCFQANRSLTNKEIETTSNVAKYFLDSWQSHEKDIVCSYTVLYNRFLILLAEDNTCSGVSCCAIDASVKFIKNLELELGVDFLDKKELAFLKQNTVFTISVPNLPTAIKNGQISQDTLYFDNTISRKLDIDTIWPRLIKSSWIYERF